jgi:hypothetical protein
MRVLQRAVAVFVHQEPTHQLWLFTLSGKKNERNIPATLFDVSRQQHQKSRAGRNLFRRVWKQ